MRLLIFGLSLIFFINGNALSQSRVTLPNSFSVPILEELKPFFLPSEGQIEDLLKGHVISESKVESLSNKQQKLMLFTAGVHPRNCTRAMRKLSLYENYNQFMSFIKASKYDDSTQRVSFVIDHALLPYQMILRFKIPRITKEGHYPFTFEDGMLKDLKGTIGVKEVGKFCLLSLKADWQGPETQIPSMVLGTFAQTIGKIGLEHLIRVSLF